MIREKNRRMSVFMTVTLITLLTAGLPAGVSAAAEEAGTVPSAAGNSGSDTVSVSIRSFMNSQQETAPSDNPVWDGVSVDVSWYLSDPDAESFTIKTGAQMAGLAALVNGLVNESCRVWDGVLWTAASDWNQSSYVNEASSDDSGPNGNNMSTGTYHYGICDFNGKTILIDADLDMSAANYMPVGGQYLMTPDDTSTKLSSSFNGTFDGQGHNITIQCSRWCSGNYGDGQSVGLIGRLGCHDSDAAELWPTDPAVKNVAVYGSVYANRSVGGIVGKTGKTTLNSGDSSTGAVISGCANFASVSNTDSKGCGGIAGAFWNGGLMENCYNAGNVSTAYTCPTAGLAGSNENVIKNSYNTGTITAVNDSYAMAIGTNNGGAPMKVITNCWYLDGSAPGGGYYSNRAADNSGSMSETDMKTASFVLTLGDAYNMDTENINNGYPILKWQGGTPAETQDSKLIFEDYTDGEAEFSAAAGSGQDFTVSCGTACVAAVLKEDGSYEALKAVPVEGEEDVYAFSAGNAEGTVKVAIVFRGDVNMDGSVDSIDAVQVKAASLSRITLSELAAVAADVNEDGGIGTIDVVQIKAVSLSKFAFGWQI